MCNQWCLQFARSTLGHLPEASRVLEVGSRNVNGTVRDLIEPVASWYIGVDIVPGPGVDQILNVLDLERRFAPGSFDLVVTTEMIEHCGDWKRAMVQMVQTTRCGGLLMITTRSPGFALHGYPQDHWRFTNRDMGRILGPVGDLLLLEDDMTLDWPCGVGALVRKTARADQLRHWQEQLDDLEVYRVDPARDREDVHRRPVAGQHDPNTMEQTDHPPAGRLS